MSLDRARAMFAGYEPPQFDWPETRIIAYRRPGRLTLHFIVINEVENFRQTYFLQAENGVSWFGEATIPTDETMTSGPANTFPELTDRDLIASLRNAYHTRDIRIVWAD